MADILNKSWLNIISSSVIRHPSIHSSISRGRQNRCLAHHGILRSWSRPSLHILSLARFFPTISRTGPANFAMISWRERIFNRKNNITYFYQSYINMIYVYVYVNMYMYCVYYGHSRTIFQTNSKKHETSPTNTMEQHFNYPRKST